MADAFAHTYEHKRLSKSIAFSKEMLPAGLTPEQWHDRQSARLKRIYNELRIETLLNELSRLDEGE